MLQAVTLSLFNKIHGISLLFMHNLHIFTNLDFMKLSKGKQFRIHKSKKKGSADPIYDMVHDAEYGMHDKSVPER